MLLSKEREREGSVINESNSVFLLKGYLWTKQLAPSLKASGDLSGKLAHALAAIEVDLQPVPALPLGELGGRLEYWAKVGPKIGSKI